MYVRVVSVQTSQVKQFVLRRGDGREQVWQTGFAKEPVDEPVFLDVLGMTGDAQADTKHHGGPDKAVLFYSLTHYPKWQQSYPDLPIGPGGFGENLTISECDEHSVCVGDVYAIGEAIVEVSQPRVPCWKISARWQEPTLTDAVRTSGRTGWYARVRQAGWIEPGASIKRLAQGQPAFTIATLNDLLAGRQAWDKAVIRQLRDCCVLADAWKVAIPSE